jgi:hypothetical protein
MPMPKIPTTPPFGGRSRRAGRNFQPRAPRLDPRTPFTCVAYEAPGANGTTSSRAATSVRRNIRNRQHPIMTSTQELALSPENLTPAQATSVFCDFAQARARDLGNDLVKGWSQTRDLHPELFQRMSQLRHAGLAGSRVEQVQEPAAVANAETLREYGAAFRVELALANQDPVKAHTAVMNKYPALAERLRSKPAAAANASAPPVGYQFFLPMMQLPGSTTEEEFRAAWIGNGGKATPLNAKDVFDALVGFTAGKQNESVADARALVEQKFSALATAARKADAEHEGTLRVMSELGKLSAPPGAAAKQ